ncbi:MAG TPA: carbohydrate kinase family protein [Miltoncostaea sp.]|nr:carbohydrate kinase family protein [Miltoncostaea sp.]
MGSGGPALLCIGNVTIDEAVQPDGTSAVAPGGDALFAALAARLHMDRVGWLAPVGDDLPEEVLDELAAVGLSAAGLVRRDVPTIRNVVTYGTDGSRRWELVHGDAHFEVMSVHPADVPPGLLEADGILVSGMAPEAQAALTPWLRTRTGAAIYLDLQEDGIAGHEDAWRGVIAASDVFLPSEVEAVALAGTDDLEAAMRTFRDLGPRVVVVKRAERGCLVLSAGEDEVVEVPADPVRPLDSTGAGDAFCGAFAAADLLGADPLEAARAGAAAARVAIGANGYRALLDAAAAVAAR